jgi:hypothetical protein
VERRLSPVTSVKSSPSCAYTDGHSPWRGVPVDFLPTHQVVMQRFDQLVQCNHLIGF